MTVVFPVSQNPVVFMDATTLLEPPNTIELTSDIVKGIFDPLGMQISQEYANFGPSQNVTIPFTAPRANVVAIIQIKADNNEGLGAFQCAFGHVGIGNEDVIFVLSPTEKQNFVIVLFSPTTRDRFRIFNSSFSSYSINVSLVDGVRVPAPPIPISSSGSGVDVLIKNWEKMIEAYNQSFLLPLIDPVSGNPQVVPVGVIRPCGETPAGPIG